MRRTATCHGDRPHYAKGACRACYDATRNASPEGRAKKHRIHAKWYRSRKGREWVFRRGLRGFGVTVERYEEMLVAQDGKCAICGGGPGRRRFDIDHDHSCCPGDKSCGRCVRGLLCAKCNVGLGSFRDSAAIVDSAATYLRRPA